MSQVVYITESEPSIEPFSQTQPDWIHPNLLQSTDPIKGRQFRVSGLIPKGACLLVDRPYAVIPVVDDPANHDHLICSNPACNRQAPRHSASEPARNRNRTPCPNACIPDVTWCTETCRDADQGRHAFECTWLKRYAAPIRAKWGEYDFGMLWVIVRLLAMRQGQLQHVDIDIRTASSATATEKKWKCGWEGIDSLCGSAETWSHDKVRAWTTLVKKYLQNGPVLPHGMASDQVLHLICQEEANSFGLYPRATGVVPLPYPSVDRGEQFAAAVYPTAAIANHSCLPNITHKPDEQGRMVFTASRDIFAGEECCISYFDLTQHTDLTSRREHLRQSFKFICQCERCVSEEPVEEPTEWSAMPMMGL
ncbi:hypothetical protein PENANT_c001G05984 [Penicillium antarcticum]|uniref:SET domain-containing protein n=1 Tax=Penicillium antarcticum TaxID=416450 RepID=A0A1V6QNM0_9EURO|nr:uncharacterized protein N7508_010692 [Penicillium antarcticum]KAJ5295871.1 hypothetical protein N7508_010692 [Penicillium antarcticum]OQD90834.1 hypothetical protein PENANT_c001G05984 [Penicillium antarcticum]